MYNYGNTNRNEVRGNIEVSDQIYGIPNRIDNIDTRYFDYKRPLVRRYFQMNSLTISARYPDL